MQERIVREISPGSTIHPRQKHGVSLTNQNQLTYEGIENYKAMWEPPSKLNFKKSLPYQIIGQTKLGLPILTISLASWKLNRVDSPEKLRQLYSYIESMFIMVRQSMRRNEQKLGWNINTFTSIINADGISFRNVMSRKGINIFRKLLQRFELQYSISLKSCYIVNATLGFKLSYQMILKRILSSCTQSKIHIYGTNSEEWRKVLLSKIPDDQLPIELGGAAAAGADCNNLDFINKYKIWSLQPGPQVKSHIEFYV